MTDTQFQVGGIYPTADGDEVRVISFNGPPLYPLVGQFVKGGGHHYWTLGGRFDRVQKMGLDLLLPEPAAEAPSDDKAELLAACKALLKAHVASLRLTGASLDLIERVPLIVTARRAIAKAERT